MNSRSQLPARLLAGILLSASSTWPCRGEAPALPRIAVAETGFSVTRWTIEDGLPLQLVTSLAETPAGFLGGAGT